MGKLTISLTESKINPDFSGAFKGKTYTIKVPDTFLKDGSDEFKKAADLKSGDKLKVLLKDAKEIKTHLFAHFDDATFTSTIEELGTHDVEVKLKGSTVSAKLQFQTSDGKETRVVVAAAPRKLGAHPKSVKIEDAANAAGSGCPAPGDLKHLLTEMAKTDSYVWSGKTGIGNGWTPTFDGHYTHEEPKVAGWKSYVDEPSQKTKTTWRLLFKLDFVEKTEQVVIKIVTVQQEHK